MVPEEMINFGGSVSGLTVASINLGNAQPKFQQLIKEEMVYLMHLWGLEGLVNLNWVQLGQLFPPHPSSPSDELNT